MQKVLFVILSVVPLGCISAEKITIAYGQKSTGEPYLVIQGHNGQKKKVPLNQSIEIDLESKSITYPSIDVDVLSDNQRFLSEHPTNIDYSAILKKAHEIAKKKSAISDCKDNQSPWKFFKQVIDQETDLSLKYEAMNDYASYLLSTSSKASILPTISVEHEAQDYLEAVAQQDDFIDHKMKAILSLALLYLSGRMKKKLFGRYDLTEDTHEILALLEDVKQKAEEKAIFYFLKNASQLVAAAPFLEAPYPLKAIPHLQEAAPALRSAAPYVQYRDQALRLLEKLKESQSK